jgi:tRNA A-37 threonylcarbamoyl transferase component Bud32/signal recognition particle receptor subunit beta
MAGKTTNLERVYLNAPPERRGKLSSIATEGERTLFFDYMPLDLGMIQGLRVRLAIYTVPGQALYAATRRTVLQGVDGVVFVADSEPERIDESVSALAELERILPQVRGRELRELPLVFQWNKRDLGVVLSEDQLAARLNPWGRPSVAATAKEGKGVLETLRLISQATLKDCREQLGLRADAPGTRPLRHARTSRRLRKLRAQRVAELHRVPATRSGRSSEAPTLPYGRRRRRAGGTRIETPQARPVRTPIPPQRLPRKSPVPLAPEPESQRPLPPSDPAKNPPERQRRAPSERQRKAPSERQRPPVSEKPAEVEQRRPISERKTQIPATPRIPGTVSGGSGVQSFDLTESFEVLIPPSEVAPIAELRESAARLEGPPIKTPGKTPISDSVLSRDELCPWSSVSQVLPPRLDPVIGQTVGAWKIHAKLGEGGMGAVYLARHPRLRKEVVVKVLKPELADRPRRVERFLREARLGARLSHPNLVSVQDVGTSECGLHYMVMEYVEGVNLHERIQANGAFEPEEALRIVTEVAKALRVLHEAGVIHRDVKSENVVITPKGQVKLIDFGLAKDLADGDQLTLPGALIGTPVYMAPEIGRVREVDHRVDIYSLGLTWYCLLTGQQPFAGHDVHRVILGKVPLPRPRASTGDALDPWTQNVLARMLAWHREERHPNLRATIKDLEALTRRPSGRQPQADRWALTRPQNRRTKPKPAPAGAAALPAAPPDTDPRLILLSLLNLALSTLAILFAGIALLS